MNTGVWRAKAIRAVGGWNSRTTVEDMDLSLRAFMAGWAAVYLTDVTVLNEVQKRASYMSETDRLCSGLKHSPWPCF